VEKREGFRYALMGVCWCGKDGGRFTRSRASSVIGWKCMLDFSLVGSKLHVGIKVKEAASY
jgi:hypothetical protein